MMIKKKRSIIALMIVIVSIYVNGVLQVTTTLTGLNTYLINASTDNLTIGRDALGWGEIFTGYVDEAQIINSVKTCFP